MAEKQVYLDHAATSFLREEALEEMMPYLTDKFGNPSSVYSLGREARVALNLAREKVAEALGAQPDDIFFTSGGTEANNIAIQGVVKAYGRKAHLITSSVEHHAVLDVCRELAREGHELTVLPVDRYGMVDVEDVKNALRDDTLLISVMAANNEVGTLQPIGQIGKLARERGIIFHTDAVQAVGNIPIDVNELGIDILSLSAHKFNGPKGVGALFASRRARLSPLYRGGAQERKLRPGTENVPGIVGMGKAIELTMRELPEKSRQLTVLRDRLIEGLLAMGEISLNGHPQKRLPGNVNVSFKYIEGEAMLLSLDREGVIASSGSACTSGSLDPSHVLLAMGLDHETSHGSIRFTFGKGNKADDVEYVLKIIKPVVQRLREMSAVYRPE